MPLEWQASNGACANSVLFWTVTNKPRVFAASCLLLNPCIVLKKMKEGTGFIFLR